MLWCCRSLLLTVLVLSFWAKGKLKVYLSGDTSYFCGLPFYSLEINSVYGVGIDWGNLAGNLIIFSLLYAALTMILERGEKWQSRLSVWWLIALLIALSGNLWIDFPQPPCPGLLLLLFCGYAVFSSLGVLSILKQPGKSRTSNHDKDQI